MTNNRVVLIDTNTILRLLIADIPDQLAKSKEIFGDIESGKSTGLVSILVINEFLWVLEKFYEKSKKESVESVLKILSLKSIRVPEINKKKLMFVLTKNIENSLDFTDIYLILTAKKTKTEIVSFDKKLLKSI